jgi:chromatin segregation and condensation protein Rec8/ScpA/Scc1 (kleisin family)
MAILELIRLREVVAVQKGIFGEIEVLRNRENLATSFQKEQNGDSNVQEQSDSVVIDHTPSETPEPTV